MSDFQSRLQSALGHEFLIERELGGGGMSRVFVATEKALQRRVVIKVLPPELAAGVNIERFRREITLAAGLQHPHIVPLLAAGDDNGLLWFSMPFIEGESLRAALAKQGRLPARDVVRILHDVVDALAYAHSRGIVHRDIKPDNVLASGFHALVTDFGVAKALSAAVPLPGGTTTGMAIGTPAYMAPEQLAADPAADHRVDLYAVGLLAYELLTGKSPFSGVSPQATLAAQLTKMPEPPHLSFTDIPAELSAVILHCLEKDAGKRPQSAAALLAELEALPPMGGHSVPPVRPKRKSTKVLMGAAAVILVAFTALVASDDGPRTTAERDARARANRTTKDDGRSTARDAGPGSASAPAGAARSAPPETVIVVYRDPGAADGSQGVQVPVVISRAESLAIADAMRKRMASTPATTSEPDVAARTEVGADARAATGQGGTGQTLASGQVAASAGPAGGAMRAQMRIVRPDGTLEFALNRADILKEAQRIFTDSMSFALKQMDSALARIPQFVRMEPGRPPGGKHSVVPIVAPNADGRLRVVVGNYRDATGRRDMDDLGREVSAFLRASLPADRYEVVDPALIEKAARQSPDRMAVGWALRSDYVVSGVLRLRNDSLSVHTVFTDVRGGRNSHSIESLVPATEPKRAFENALAHVMGWLEQAKTRRPNPAPAPAVPLPPVRGSERGA